MVPTVTDPKFGLGIPAADFNPRELPDAGPPIPAPSPDCDRGPWGGEVGVHKFNNAPPSPDPMPDPPCVRVHAQAFPRNTRWTELSVVVRVVQPSPSVDSVLGAARERAAERAGALAAAREAYRKGSELFARLDKLRDDLAGLKDEAARLPAAIDSAEREVSVALAKGDDPAPAEKRLAKLKDRAAVVERRVRLLPAAIAETEAAAKREMGEHLGEILDSLKGEAAAELSRLQGEFFRFAVDRLPALAEALFLTESLKAMRPE